MDAAGAGVLDTQVMSLSSSGHSMLATTLSFVAQQLVFSYGEICTSLFGWFRKMIVRMMTVDIDELVGA
jgi:hypothetical protein